MSAATPTAMPPSAAGAAVDAGVGTSAPTLTPANAGMTTTAKAAATGMPTLAPSGTGGMRGTLATTVTGTWQTSVTIAALWYADEIRNAWMYVNGIGWTKIYNGSDGAFTALCSLAAQARQTGSSISFRQEADGMCHEIYLW